MLLKELLEYCKVKAIGDCLQRTEEAVYREMCRSYSESFYTPLLQVYELDPEHVFLNVFEHQLKDFDSGKNAEILYEELLRIENPNFESDQNEDFEKYVQKVIEEDKLQKEKKGSKKVEEPPLKGGVDFSHLEEEG